MQPKINLKQTLANHFHSLLSVFHCIVLHCMLKFSFMIEREIRVLNLGQGLKIYKVCYTLKFALLFGMLLLMNF